MSRGRMVERCAEFRRRLKHHYGWSFGMFCDKVGIKRDTMHYIVAKGTPPTMANIQRICKVLTREDAEWLMGLDIANGGFKK